ncbi:MAG TPA: hypothetical protein VIW29_07525, partial [Polyangiaceae bacterium]
MTKGWRSAWREPAPARRLALLRVLVGGFAVLYLLARFRDFTNMSALATWQFSPVGAAQLLHEPLPQPAVVAGVVGALLLGAAFTLGLRYRLVAPLFALLLLWVTSYRSSWGMLFHTDNLLLLHVLLLAAAPAADAYAWGGRSEVPASADAVHARYGWAIQALCLLTVVTYLVAGVAKLKLAGLGWLDGEQLRAQIAYDNLRKIELGRGPSSFGVWLVRHPALFPALAVLTLVVELGAPLALLHRRLALVWALAAWGFHVGVVVSMNIKFPYPLAWVPYLAFFRVERLAETALGRRLLSAL